MNDGMDVPRDVLAWVVAAVAVGLLLLSFVVAQVRRWLRRRRARARIARASRGEVQAATWLVDLGYEILGAQVVAEHVVGVDDAFVTVELRADYVVEREGKRFVAEVKTGRVAPRIDSSATRRQLLEYRVAFDVDGVLLVDAEVGEVRAVTFPRLERAAEPSTSPLLGAFAVVALSVLVLAIVRAF